MSTLTAPALRWYQTEALDAVFDWFQHKEGNPAVVLPTGAGKSLLLSAIIERARSNHPIRVAVLATQAELVKQNANAAALLNGRESVGIYSAGLGQKDASRPITVANIQSVARQAYGLEPFDLVIIDEAHTIADADSGQYRTFLEAQRQQNPALAIVGLTATPFKLSSGLITEGPTALFAGIAYEAPVLRLIDDGFLCRPITPRASLALALEDVAVRGGEYVPKALAEAVDVDAITHEAVTEMIDRFADRHHWLVFAVSVEHARHIGQVLTARGIPTAVVHGELDRDERAYRLQAFEDGDVRAIVNCQLLTTGWDCQKIDAIALLRPTKSAGLYAQMVGRGMRVHPTKSDCLVLDFARLVEKFGPVDAIQIPSREKRASGGPPPAKLCPSCELYVATSVRLCPLCGHEFPPPAIELSGTASGAAILSTDREPTWHAITSVQYMRHENPAKPTPTLRADYYTGYRRVASEWVCIEHSGFARDKAEGWWALRSGERAPRSVDAAVALSDELRQPVRIGILPDPKNPKYTRIAQVEFEGQPQERAGSLPRACWSCTHFDTLVKSCTHWQAAPPPEVQSAGCDAWTDEDELPF